MENVEILDSEFLSDVYSSLLLQRYNQKFNIEQEFTEVVFLDVGAGMPEFYSNSLYFRKLGAKIISIEPIPSFCEMFREKNWDVLEYAVTKDDTKSSIMFTEMRHSDKFKGLAGSAIKNTNLDSINFPDEVYSEYEVKCLSLNSILKKYYPKIKRIDILDVDIEGQELEVLKSFNFKKYKPKVLIIENLNPETNGYYDFYNQIGYKVLYKCGHNDILMRNIK